MAKYRVAITRTETQVYVVKAETGAWAVDKISDAWIAGDIEMDEPELCDTDFVLIGLADSKEGATA